MSKKIGLNEAILMVMRAQKCSRRKARKIVGDWIKQGKLNYTVTPQPMPAPIPPEEASEAFMLESENAYMPLGYFIQRLNFNVEDIVAELRSGRLVAHANEDQQMGVELGIASPLGFAITAKAIHDWLHHPKTPQHLIDHIVQVLGHLPN